MISISYQLPGSEFSVVPSVILETIYIAQYCLDVSVPGMQGNAIEIRYTVDETPQILEYSV